MNANPDAVMTRNGLLKSLPRNGRTIEKVDWENGSEQKELLLYCELDFGV